jgi:hypothetical protein
LYLLYNPYISCLFIGAGNRWLIGGLYTAYIRVISGYSVNGRTVQEFRNMLRIKGSMGHYKAYGWA